MYKKINPRTNFRWIILVILFIANTILCIDRSAPGILAPDLQNSIGWSEEQYGIINSVFMIAYAICFILMGRLMDTIGPRKVYLISILIWSLSALGHALARTWIGFAVARFSLKSDIFPKKATCSIAGFGGFAGVVGGAIAAFSVGKILQNTGTDGYSGPFAIAGLGYLFALLNVHLLVPKIKPINIQAIQI